VPSRIAMKRVLEQEPSLPAVAQICATCDVDTVPLPSPDVLPPLPPPEPLSALVASPVVPLPAVVLVTAGVEEFTDTFTDADEFEVLAPIPASDAAVPVPVALAPVPAPLLLAVAVPLENASVLAVPAPVSTDPS